MVKRVLVVCGTAIATSTHVAMTIKDICKRAGIDVDIIQARVQEVYAYKDSVDLIVSTVQLPPSLPVPAFSGIPFLTGVGDEELGRQIVSLLK